MKNFRIILSIALMLVTLNASAARYKVIRLTLRGYRIVTVNKPKNLKKWTYDSDNDVYYRVRSMAGIGHPVHLPANTHKTQYVRLTPSRWGVKMTYVDKPKNLKKWHYDKKSDTYYHGRNTFGTCDVFFKDRSKA